jgi:hypothetical protein
MKNLLWAKLNLNVAIACFFAGYFSLLINIDGIINALNPSHLSPGSFNYILFFLFLMPSLGMVFSVFFILKEKSLNTTNLMLAFFAVLLSLFTVLVCYDDIKYTKAFRDSSYICFFYFFVSFASGAFRINERLLIKFLKLFVILNIIVFPCWGLIADNFDYEYRFSGMQLSPAVFGTSLSLFFIIISNSKFGICNRLILYALCLMQIFLTGSRAALIVVLFYKLFYYFFEVKDKSPIKILIILIPLTIIIFASGMLSPNYWTGIIDLFGANRIFSVGDIEGGSLDTRVNWYIMMWDRISDNGFIGGYGAGSSEKMLGFISHFDLLRFWYDYSVFFMIIFFLSLYFIFRLNGDSFLKWWVAMRFLFMIALITLVSFHNVFQAPSLLFLLALTLSLLSMRPMSGPYVLR